MIVASYVRDAGKDTYCVLDTTALVGSTNEIKIQPAAVRQAEDQFW